MEHLLHSAVGVDAADSELSSSHCS